MIKKKKICEKDEKSINLYFNEIAKYGQLTYDEELKLWKDYKNNGNIESKNKLIFSNLKFVASVAKGYMGRGLSYADLIAEGNIGLLKSFDKFDEDRGFKTTSYSVWWIKQMILEALDKRNISDTDDLPQEFEKQDGKSEFVDNAFLVNSETNNKQTLEKETIVELMSCLNERERDIIDSYYGLNGCGPMTLEELGKERHLTKERIRQIIEKSLKKLRNEAMYKNITNDIYR